MSPIMDGFKGILQEAHYEILIKHAIASTSASTRETGIKMGFLSCLAYYMFSNEKQGMKSDELTQFCVSVYAPQSKLTVNSSRIVRELETIHVLLRDDDTYYFSRPYEYQYFVAHFMAENVRSHDRKLQSHIGQMIVRLCNNLHKENYANIVMFLCYLCKDPIVMDLLTERANMLFADVEPFDLNKNVQFLNKFQPKKLLKTFAELPGHESREAVLKSQDRVDLEDAKSIVLQGEVNAVNDLDLIPSIVYSLSLINILGQVLRNYLGSSSLDSQKIIDSCYRLGLRVLQTIFRNLDDGLAQLRLDYWDSLEHKDSLMESEVNALFSKYVFETSLLLSMLVIRNITLAVGAPELEAIYEDVKKGLDTLSVAFLNLSIKLEHYKRKPVKETIELHEAVLKNIFACELLTQLVVLNMYLYPWTLADRQPVLSKFGLEKDQKNPNFLLPGRKLLQKVDKRKPRSN